ncbi:hypothetical protein PvNV_057 [Penaeus vannamei nudivirus]|nr:ephrin type-B receptor 4-like [Penaeus vannamei nucleopolyhedrovirus]
MDNPTAFTYLLAILILMEIIYIITNSKVASNGKANFGSKIYSNYRKSMGSDLPYTNPEAPYVDTSMKTNNQPVVDKTGSQWQVSRFVKKNYRSTDINQPNYGPYIQNNIDYFNPLVQPGIVEDPDSYWSESEIKDLPPELIETLKAKMSYDPDNIDPLNPPVDPVEPVNPVEPVEPPIDPTEPVSPTEPPVDPDKETKPAEPMDTSGDFKLDELFKIKRRKPKSVVITNL